MEVINLGITNNCCCVYFNPDTLTEERECIPATETCALFNENGNPLVNDLLTTCNDCLNPQPD